MQTLLCEPHTSVVEGAAFRRATSFGAVYEGTIEHGNGRSNSFVECVPQYLAHPYSAVVIGGGFTSSEEHYSVVQRQLGLHGERSVFAGHIRHGHYEIGHNAEDIAQTCEALALGGVRRIILLGHSRGGPEVLEAHEMLRQSASSVQVTDIVLAFPAQFIEGFPAELAKSGPKFVLEMALGLVRHPRKQVAFNVQAIRNVCTDAERTVKEAWYLLTHHSGKDLVGRMRAREERPRLHFVVGLFDGLIAGKAVLKTLEDSEHDTLTVLRSGHIDLNTAPEVTDIILAKVRSRE